MSNDIFIKAARTAALSEKLGKALDDMTVAAGKVMLAIDDYQEREAHAGLETSQLVLDAVLLEVSDFYSAEAAPASLRKHHECTAATPPAFEKSSSAATVPPQRIDVAITINLGA
ncbi:hypothetical protein [Silvimonas sp.]|uniref:hypothetical protein n=1 Tax=Silvimonas sp. TaxID=2650811 RepID=UPI002841B494|nr:hypothetical protein [Silvimonas sp.]MDR3428992.1 hypothetical protein [Silvimonas sp.]